MKYSIGLPTKAFNAIRAGTKKVEGRVPDMIPNEFGQMEIGNEIEITNEDTQEKITVIVQFVHHYPDVRNMLETEGIKNVLSSGGTIEEGIERYNSFVGYKENVLKYGIYAIGIKPKV